MKNATPDEADDAMEPVVVPIDGVLDLHTFAPKELDDLLHAYIDACSEENILACESSMAKAAVYCAHE